MGHQLTRHRLAAGFPPLWHVAAKSGGLLGVIERPQPDAQRFYVAVFTRAEPTATGSPSTRPSGPQQQPQPKV